MYSELICFANKFSHNIFPAYFNALLLIDVYSLIHSGDFQQADSAEAAQLKIT